MTVLIEYSSIWHSIGQWMANTIQWYHREYMQKSHICSESSLKQRRLFSLLFQIWDALLQRIFRYGFAEVWEDIEHARLSHWLHFEWINIIFFRMYMVLT